MISWNFCICLCLTFTLTTGYFSTHGCHLSLTEAIGTNILRIHIQHLGPRWCFLFPYFIEVRWEVHVNSDCSKFLTNSKCNLNHNSLLLPKRFSNTNYITGHTVLKIFFDCHWFIKSSYYNFHLFIKLLSRSYEEANVNLFVKIQT